jgi:hypothetical protein
MAKETIGLVVMNWQDFADKESGTPLTGLGYMAVKQLPNGTVRALFTREAREHATLGFKPVAAVRSEVTRRGTKTTHDGYDLHCLEGTPPSVRETLKHLGPVIVDGLIEPYYDRIGATKESIAAKDDRS